MGLDMYAYKIRRLSDDEVSKISGKKNSDVEDDYSTILCKDIYEDEQDMLHDLMPYTRKVSLIGEFVDFDKIKKENHIPKTAGIVGNSYSGDKIGYTFASKGEHFDVSFSWDEFESKYVFEKQKDFYVYASTEVAYWRKEYDTQAAIHEVCSKTIENCGYYLCNNDMLDAMIASGSVEAGAFKCGEDEAIFYHEWY